MSNTSQSEHNDLMWVHEQHLNKNNALHIDSIQIPQENYISHNATGGCGASRQHFKGKTAETNAALTLEITLNTPRALHITAVLYRSFGKKSQ